MKSMRGFTLIELMIVIAIIGTLAVMAVPSYQDRIIRTQVEEALALSRMATRAVDRFYQQQGRLPENNGAAGLPPPEKIVGNFVTRLEVREGVVALTLGHRVNRHAEGKVLTLRPAIVADTPQVPIAWVCGAAPVPPGMEAPPGTVLTTLPTWHLPLECRI